MMMILRMRMDFSLSRFQISEVFCHNNELDKALDDEGDGEDGLYENS